MSIDIKAELEKLIEEADIIADEIIIGNEPANMAVRVSDIQELINKLDGHVLVPVEPTEEMQSRGAVRYEWGCDCSSCRHACSEIYKAMVSTEEVNT